MLNVSHRSVLVWYGSESGLLDQAVFVIEFMMSPTQKFFTNKFSIIICGVSTFKSFCKIRIKKILKNDNRAEMNVYLICLLVDKLI
jgi:hypothetical protein